ncbi:sugar ABC transporter substrate-binding protein [Cryptosporangium japonicum]|uniref:Substrate-binding domain-containing protein n=1 Tax=Cryptosporangium japonicum TaxID=80872 RepID=A0ABP3EL06_9ACTN
MATTLTRRLLAGASAVLLATSLAACNRANGSGGGDDEFTVGVVALDATQITANRERKAAQDAMKKLGWKTVEVNSNGNPAEAITAIQNLVQRKVDAIVVQTYTPDQLTAGLAAAKAADIPVFSSSGGEAGGTMAGAVELVNAAAVNDPLIEKLKSMPKVELLELRYTPGAPCRARADDLDAKLKDLPQVNVTRQEVKIPGGQQSAQQATSGWLQKYKDTPGTNLVIWPCFSEAALGAVAAEQQLKRGPYELYTWDVSKPAVEALKAGTMSAVLWIQVEEAGQQLADLIQEYRDGKDGWKTKTVPAPSVLLTPDNIDKYLSETPDLGA